MSLERRVLASWMLTVVAILRLRRFLVSVLEQEAHRLVAANPVSDPAEDPVLFEFLTNGCHRLALLLGDPLHLAIHFVPGGFDALALRHLVQKQRGFHVANGFLALG